MLVPNHLLCLIKLIPGSTQGSKNAGISVEFKLNSNFWASSSNSQLHPVVTISQPKLILEQFAHCILS